MLFVGIFFRVNMGKHRLDINMVGLGWGLEGGYYIRYCASICTCKPLYMVGNIYLDNLNFSRGIIALKIYII